MGSLLHKPIAHNYQVVFREASPAVPFNTLHPPIYFFYACLSVCGPSLLFVQLLHLSTCICGYPPCLNQNIDVNLYCDSCWSTPQQTWTEAAGEPWGGRGDKEPQWPAEDVNGKGLAKNEESLTPRPEAKHGRLQGWHSCVHHVHESHHE